MRMKPLEYERCPSRKGIFGHSGMYRRPCDDEGKDQDDTFIHQRASRIAYTPEAWRRFPELICPQLNLRLLASRPKRQGICLLMNNELGVLNHAVCGTS